MSEQSASERSFTQALLVYFERRSLVMLGLGFASGLALHAHLLDPFGLAPRKWSIGFGYRLLWVGDTLIFIEVLLGTAC